MRCQPSFPPLPSWGTSTGRGVGGVGKVPNQSYFSSLNFRVAFISVLGSTTLVEAVQTEKIKIPTVIEPLEKHAKKSTLLREMFTSPKIPEVCLCQNKCLIIYNSALHRQDLHICSNN